jgi:putative phosphoesterase
VKIVIISDIHGNFDALSALPEDCDELWVLGDLVNYGPQPGEVIEYVKEKASLVARGNHDQSVGYGEDPRCSPRFREMAEATQRFSDAVLTSEQKSYLRSLLPRIEVQRSQTRFFLCHATPSDPLFEYRQAASEKWAAECPKLKAEVIFVGHTHIPFTRSFKEQIVVNPGSLGQSKTGKPDARYAVWENGRLSLRSYRYPIDKTIQKIRLMPVSKKIQEELVSVLEAGGISPG